MIKRTLLRGAAVLAVLAPVAASAAEPTYTSQIADALEAINMTNIIADVGAFAGMGFQLLLATMGILFVARKLRAFLR